MHSDTQSKLTVELLVVVSVMVVTAAEKELVKGDDLEGQGAARSGCNYSPAAAGNVIQYQNLYFLIYF